MRKMREKMNKQGGFTLIEMLIVVAIIAILIAISIPLLSTSLEKAREATDKANERSAMAVAIIKSVTEPADELKGETFCYQVTNTEGDLVPEADFEEDADGSAYGQCKEHSGGYIKITYGNDDVSDITLEWSEGGAHLYGD